MPVGKLATQRRGLVTAKNIATHGSPLAAVPQKLQRGAARRAARALDQQAPRQSDGDGAPTLARGTGCTQSTRPLQRQRLCSSAPAQLPQGSLGDAPSRVSARHSFRRPRMAL